MDRLVSVFRAAPARRVLSVALLAGVGIAAPAQDTPSEGDPVCDGREVAERIADNGIRELIRSLSAYEGPVPGALRTLNRIGLAPNETLYCLVRGGAYVLSADRAMLAELHTEPAGSAIGSRRALLQQAARTDVGSGSVFDLNNDETDLIRRDLSWSTLFFGGTWWTWIVERIGPVDAIPGQPLAGRWAGAYSYTSSRLDTQGNVMPGKEAGTLSAILLQDGPRCLVRVVSRDWTFAGPGVVADNEISVGRPSPEGARVFHATYSPDDDRIRGELRVATPSEAGAMTIFLQRAAPE